MQKLPYIDELRDCVGWCHDDVDRQYPIFDCMGRPLSPDDFNITLKYGECCSTAFASPKGFKLPTRFHYSSGMLHPHKWKTLIFDKENFVVGEIQIGLDPNDKGAIDKETHKFYMRKVLREYRGRVRAFDVQDASTSRWGDLGFHLTVQDETSYQLQSIGITANKILRDITGLRTKEVFAPYYKLFAMGRCEKQEKRVEKSEKEEEKIEELCQCRFHEACRRFKKEQESNRVRWLAYDNVLAQDEHRRFKQGFL